MAKGRRPKSESGFRQSSKPLKHSYFSETVSVRDGSPARSGSDRAQETRLLRRARAGDPAALRQLLGHVSKPAFRFGMTFCRDREDAEEIAQDVLASLVRSLPSYRGDASLSTWAYTVARNACIRRRRRPSPPMESLDAWRANRDAEPADPAGGPETPMERREINAAIEGAIRALPPALREAVVLRDVEGLSAGEAAAVLRIGERAFKSRLHRARLHLRAALSPLREPSPGDGEASPSRRCPDIALYMSRHLEGEVDATLCTRLEAHVRACPSCAATCRSLRATLRACGALRRKALPSGTKTALNAALREAGIATRATR